MSWDLDDTILIHMCDHQYLMSFIGFFILMGLHDEEYTCIEKYSRLQVSFFLGYKNRDFLVINQYLRPLLAKQDEGESPSFP